MSSLKLFLQLFRALLPAWKFFDEASDPAILYYRIENGPWLLCLRKIPRRWSTVFLNPQGNYLMACESLIQRLLSEAQTNDNLETSTTYQLVKKLVIFQGKLKPNTQFQFKISVEEDDIVTSPIFFYTVEV